LYLFQKAAEKIFHISPAASCYAFSSIFVCSPGTYTSISVLLNL